MNEDVLEIVRPGTGDPVPEGDVGEVVVTICITRGSGSRSAHHGGAFGARPAGAATCGSRADGCAHQTTKVKGMFVRPEQIAEIAKRHPELKRLRLVVTREGEQDASIARRVGEGRCLRRGAEIASSLQTITKLKGKVELAAPGSLPNDGKVISDECAAK